MLTSGQAMYLLVINGGKQILQLGKVIQSSRDAFTIHLEEPADLVIGQETLAFCDVHGKFFQQGARLTEIVPDLVGPAYVFSREGDPISAEQRQTFRVSVAVSNLHADIGMQKNCQVVDFSPEGFAAIAAPGFAIGTTHRFLFAHEQFTINAEVRVQTIKVLSSGKVRYGFLIPRSNVSARNTLHRLSIHFQRTQLRRLAGAA
jgi:hypothetical protein